MGRSVTETTKADAAGAAYTALARRYRSRDFDELIGQDPVARTLRNAVESGRTSHAYLFCGSRGVGKTSMARIFAKALNVTPDLVQADEIAAAILRGDDLDVIEIDGASNRGINEARDLIAAAGISPARCRFKIYIIDEVHMLTTPAFNALLKTMEEPPAHVKFILCTTEPMKVPVTIQSRCQRFDFRLLSAAEIGGQLKRILGDEGLSADERVIAQVARLAQGSMRDALTILDRLLAVGDRTLTPQLVHEMLGLPDQAICDRLVEAIAAGDSATALEAGAALLDRGASVEQALETLADHLRDLLLVSVCGPDSDLVELPAEAKEAAVRLAARFDAAGLVHMIALCASAAFHAGGSRVARTLYDAALVRLCVSEQLADIAQLLDEDGAAKPKKKDALKAPGRAPAPSPEGRDLWQRARAEASSAPNEQACVENLEFRGFDGDTLRLAVKTDDAGLARWLAGQAEAVGALVRRATRRHVRVEIEAKPVEEAAPATRRKRIDEAHDLPLVRRALEIFNASVVDVQDAGAGEEGAQDV